MSDSKDDFIISWDMIELFFIKKISQFNNRSPNRGTVWFSPILSLIKEMRKHGFDRKLYANHDIIYCLVLSRSKILPTKHHYIRIEPIFKYKNMRLKYYTDTDFNKLSTELIINNNKVMKTEWNADFNLVLEKLVHSS